MSTSVPTRILALALSALLAVSAFMAGALTTSSGARADVVTPSVEVDRTENLDGAGDTITVSGTGFVPDGEATDATRAPLCSTYVGAGQWDDCSFGGVYVVFGRFADDWQPSQSAPPTARTALTTYWGVDAADLDKLGGAPGGFALNPDGSFEITVDVSLFEDADPGEGNYGIYTYAGGGAVYEPFETFTPVSLDPAIRVSQTDDLDHAGAVVTVEGRGFVEDPEGSTDAKRAPLCETYLGDGQWDDCGFGGVYVTFGHFAPTWEPSKSAPASARTTIETYWAVPEAKLATIGGPEAGGIVLSADGAFSVDIAVAPRPQDANNGRIYGIYTYAGSGAVAEHFELAAPLTFTEASFADVAETHPFATEIVWLATRNVTGGYDDGTFRPSSPVTRQALAAFLFRIAAEDDYAAPVTAQFSDVPTTHAFYTEISWLAESGITEGYEDGTFRPTARVSRQAMAAFLFRFSGDEEPADPTTAEFTDVPLTHPFVTEISWLAGTQITTGYEDGSFRPGNSVSRQAMAAFLYRYFNPVAL